MNDPLRAFIRLYAEIIADELLTEQRDGADLPSTQQTPDAMAVREGEPHDHEKQEPLFTVRS